MTTPDEPGGIFQSPTRPHVEEHSQPAVDGSDEARRRRRNPFDVPQTDTPDAPERRGSAARPEPDGPARNTDD
jgi:hypothetical protein